MLYKRIIYLVLILGFSVFLYLLILVINHEKTYNIINADVIIILGHSIKDDNIPSDWLLERLKSGAGLYNSGYGKKIIVSGGKGRGDNVAVATVMEDWLIKHGVDKEDIIVESKSKNTLENFRYSKKITDEYNFSSVNVVTNDFHMFRSMSIGKLFYDELGGNSAEINMSFKKFFAYLKEPVSIIKYKLMMLF